MASLKRSQEALRALLEQGLRIGSTVRYFKQLMVVKSLRLAMGEVVCGCRRGGGDGRFQGREAHNLQLVEAPIDPRIDPDNWVPAGYVEVKATLAQRILKGEFGDDVRKQLVARGLFFARTTRYFLLETFFDEVRKQQIRAELDRRIAKKETHPTQRYCMQCGNEYDRPEGYEHRKRCPTCAEHPVVSSTRFCVRCATPYSRTDFPKMGDKGWAGNPHCPAHYSR